LCVEHKQDLNSYAIFKNRVFPLRVKIKPPVAVSHRKTDSLTAGMLYFQNS